LIKSFFEFGACGRTSSAEQRMAVYREQGCLRGRHQAAA
jgi:hypothetical protein